MNSDVPFAELAFKDLDYIVNNISRLLKLRDHLVEVLIQAARRENNAISWLAEKMQVTKKSILALIDDIVMEG